MASSVAVGCVLVLSSILSILVNVLVLVAWCMRRRLRKAHLYLFIHLTIVDLLSQVLWSLVSAIHAFTGESSVAALCDLQGFTKELVFTLNMHSLLLISGERLIKIIKPSRHSIMCIDTVVIVLLFGIWVFDCVIALLPIIGWSKYQFFLSQYQCTTDTVISPSYLNFWLIVTMVIPIFGMVVCYSATWCRIRSSRRKVTPQGAITLEENQRPLGDTYSDRLKKQQEKFNLAGMKKKKPYIRPKKLTFTKDGYECDSGSSSDEEPSKMRDSKIKRKYHLAKNDTSLAKTFILISLTYVCLWLPYSILTFMYTYDLYGSTSDIAFSIAVCLTHFGCFVKPLILIGNKQIRRQCLTSDKKVMAS